MAPPTQALTPPLSLLRLRRKLDPRPPDARPPAARRAAVAVVIEDAPSPRLLLVERDRRSGDPWSGDLACPGGFATRADPDLVGTAAREAQEETDVDLMRDAQWVGRLKRRVALRNRVPPWFAVEPQVFVTSPEVLAPRACQEVRRAFWCDLAEIASRPRVRIERRIVGITFHFEAIPLEPVPLWGLTLRIVDELLAALRT